MIRRLSKLWTWLPNWLSVIISLAALALGAGILAQRSWSAPVLTYVKLPKVDYQGSVVTGVMLHNTGRGVAHNVQLTIRTGEATILGFGAQSEELVTVQGGGSGANSVTIRLPRMAPGASVVVSLILDSSAPTGLEIVAGFDEGTGGPADASTQPLASPELVALLAVVLGLIGVSTAIGLVSLRKVIVGYDDLAKRLADSLSPIPLLSRREMTPIAEYLERSRYEVAIAGVTLASLSTAYRSMLRDKTKQGVRIRALVTDPDSDALESYARTDGVGIPRDTLRRQIDASLSTLAETGAEVRLLPFPPSVGLLMIDGMSPNGVLVVSIYAGGRLAQVGAPQFELTRHDGHWFEYFRDQFERLWEKSHLVSWPSSDAHTAREET